MCLAAPEQSIPIAVQRRIAMYLKYEQNIVNYALVAKHFYDWLAPYMHHKVKLHGEPEALGFLHWLQGGPEHRMRQVKELDVGRLVETSTLADILDRCQGLILLEMRCAYYPRTDPGLDPLLKPLTGLVNLTQMSVELVAYSDNAAFPLQKSKVFRRLTYLHLSPRPLGLPWKGSPIGFAELPNLTHLSLPFSLLTMKTSCASAVKAFLEKGSTQVVILWLTRLESPAVIARALHSAGIGGKRVVLFYDWAREGYELQEGGFWGRAENVVAWREQNPDHPLVSSEYVTSLKPW